MKSLIRQQLLLLLPSLSLFTLAWLSANAQTAADFFHGGAQRYLTNNVSGALEVVTNGLQRFPDDEKLQKLYELLNRQQQQQQQSQDQKEPEQDQSNEQQQDQNKQDDQKNQQAKNEQQKKAEEQKQSQDNKEQQKQDQQQAKADKSKAKPDETKEGDEPQPVTAHQMTPQEAKQLLDAQKGDEQVLIFQPQGEPKKSAKQLKDW